MRLFALAAMAALAVAQDWKAPESLQIKGNAVDWTGPTLTYETRDYGTQSITLKGQTGLSVTGSGADAETAFELLVAYEISGGPNDRVRNLTYDAMMSWQASSADDKLAALFLEFNSINGTTVASYLTDKINGVILDIDDKYTYDNDTYYNGSCYRYSEEIRSWEDRQPKVMEVRSFAFSKMAGSIILTPVPAEGLMEFEVDQPFLVAAQIRASGEGMTNSIKTDPVAKAVNLVFTETAAVDEKEGDEDDEDSARSLLVSGVALASALALIA